MSRRGLGSGRSSLLHGEAASSASLAMVSMFRAVPFAPAQILSLGWPCPDHRPREFLACPSGPAHPSWPASNRACRRVGGPVPSDCACSLSGGEAPGASVSSASSNHPQDSPKLLKTTRAGERAPKTGLLALRIRADFGAPARLPRSTGRQSLQDAPPARRSAGSRPV